VLLKVILVVVSLIKHSFLQVAGFGKFFLIFAGAHGTVHQEEEKRYRSTEKSILEGKSNQQQTC